MNDSCVYVSLSYHQGPFESNCLPALGNNTGSFTLLVIATALDWVRANLEASGRDPKNVTVSGLSAGVRDVMAMLMSSLFEGKFDKAIAFAGGMRQKSSGLPLGTGLLALPGTSAPVTLRLVGLV